MLCLRVYRPLPEIQALPDQIRYIGINSSFGVLGNGLWVSYFDQDIVSDRGSATVIRRALAVIEAAYVLRAVASLPEVSRCSASKSKEPAAGVKKG